MWETSYRTGIYPACAEDEAIARQFVAERQKDYDRPIVTEVERLVCFYDAEQNIRIISCVIRRGIATSIFLVMLPQERKA